jgi:hypothetical protein
MFEKFDENMCSMIRVHIFILDFPLYSTDVQLRDKYYRLPHHRYMQDLSTLTVRDMMTSPALSLPPSTEVTTAMAFLVDKGISGVPVTDASGLVLGVCSGYDLLALDSTPGKLDKSYFPPIDTCINEFGGDRKMMWTNFKQLRSKLKAATGSTVEEVRICTAFSSKVDFDFV